MTSPRFYSVSILRTFLISALLSGPAAAGTWVHNFNSVANDTPNGAANTNITLSGGLLNGAAANATLLSNKRDTGNTINLAIVKTNAGGTAETALRLADKNTNSGTGAMWLPVIDPGVGLSEFTLELDLLMNRQTAAATPADGFNISFGQNLSGLGGAAGHATAYGLVINFDTFQNSTADPRSIEIISDGASVFNFLASSLPGGNFTFDTTFRHVALHWDANGLDLTYGGTVICDNLPMPGFNPVAGSNFIFNSTTGGSV